MSTPDSCRPIFRFGGWLATLIILRVTAGAVIEYTNYFPPSFESVFLRGRERYFFQTYQWAFYPHLVGGPTSLILGLLLMSPSFRRRFPAGHRWLGRLQVMIVLLVVVPSGLWLSRWALGGPVATAGFVLLSVGTATSAVLGWQQAMRRRFANHQRWMNRCYILLCSAVVARILGGAGTVAGFEGEWTFRIIAWVGWLLPLAIHELTVHFSHRRSAARPRRPPSEVPADLTPFQKSSVNG